MLLVQIRKKERKNNNNCNIYPTAAFDQGDISLYNSLDRSIYQQAYKEFIHIPFSCVGHTATTKGLLQSFCNKDSWMKTKNTHSEIHLPE